MAVPIVCTGRGDARTGDHCCWIAGELCPHLEEGTVPGRRWVCGLYRELGSWEQVYADPRYLASDAAAWFADAYPGFGCGDWPQNIPVVMARSGNLCCWGDG